jgi:DNA-binding NarL/FixJ family response regulator
LNLPTADTTDVVHFTPREQQILAIMREGVLSFKAIAAELRARHGLKTNHRTVEAHITSIARKISLHVGQERHGRILGVVSFLLRN